MSIALGTFPQGTGALISQHILPPAVGADLSFSIVPRMRIRLLSLQLRLTTDFNPGNRRLGLRLSDNFIEILQAPSLVAQAPSTITYYLFQHGPFSASYTWDRAYIERALPDDTTLPAGATIETVTSGLQVGDSITDIKWYVEQWIEP